MLKSLFGLLATLGLMVMPHLCSAEDAKSFGAKFFGDMTSSKVVEVEVGGKDQYCILSISHVELDADSASKLISTKRSALIARSLLLKYVQKKRSIVDKSFSISIGGLTELGGWKNDAEVFKISCVPTDSVRVEKTINASQGAISSDEVEKELKQELSMLRKYVEQHPNSITAYQSLYDFYVLVGDVDGTNSAIDKVMELRF